MAILNDGLAKFRGMISVSGDSASPSSYFDIQNFRDKTARDQSASAALGKDFLMAPQFTSGGLHVTKNDLAQAYGIYNFAQGITHRLITFRGTMPGDPNFGVPWGNYLGKTYKNKSLVISNLTQDISDEVFKDRRTNSIQSLDVSFLDPNSVIIDLTIIPIYTGFNGLVNISLSTGA